MQFHKKKKKLLQQETIHLNKFYIKGHKLGKCFLMLTHSLHQTPPISVISNLTNVIYHLWMTFIILLN